MSWYYEEEEVGFQIGVPLSKPADFNRFGGSFSEKAHAGIAKREAATADLLARVEADIRQHGETVIPEPSAEGYDGNQIWQAQQLRDRLLLEIAESRRAAQEAAEEAANAALAEGVEHYFTHQISDWTEFLGRFGLSGAGEGGGVFKAKEGVLLPGPCSLVCVSRRRGGEDFILKGVEEVGREVSRKTVFFLGIVTDPEGWSIEWDGARADWEGIKGEETTPWA